MGATGGFELTQSFRFSKSGIEDVAMRWRHTLGIGTATEQFLGVQFMLSALSGNEIDMSLGSGDDVGHAIASLDPNSLDDEAIEQFGVHARFLESVCEVQAWLGTPLFPSVRPTPADAAEINRALSLIREPVHTGTWARIEVEEHEEIDYGDIAEAVILEPLGLTVFGQTHYLGMQQVQVAGPIFERTEGGNHLRPGTDDSVRVQLHHPNDLPEEAASQYVGPGRGRILVRSVPPDAGADGPSQAPGRGSTDNP